MFRLRQPSPLLCYLLACAQLFFVAGCSQDSINGSGTGATSTVSGLLSSTDMGQVVFDLYREDIAAEPASSARDAQLAELDGREAAFVKAVNDVVNLNTVQGVTHTTDALYALVDDGTLPTLTTHLAATLDDLSTDPRALDGLVALLNGSRQQAMPVEQVVELLGRMFNYPDTQQLWQAVAQLIEENDGIPSSEPDLVRDLLAFLADTLRDAGAAGPPSTQLSQALDEVIRAMVEEATIRGPFDFGAPEWVAAVDDRGLAKVAMDPATGRVYPPFVDFDLDGLADVDLQKRFVDVNGQALDMPTFGAPNAPGYDAAGRAMAPSGLPLYEYVDAKATILALHLQLAGELLARDVHSTGRRLAEVGLGPVTGPGTYDPNNPVIDLVWGLLELVEPDVAPRTLRTLAALINQDPALAERVLVTISRALEASQAASGQSSFSSQTISDPRVLQLVDDLLPIADDLFEQPAAGSISTARQLIDTLADLSTTAPDFPAQLAPLFVYRSVQRETAPDGDRNDIAEASSIPVDPNQPAWIGSVDNRSAVQQLLDLLARTDGCTFFGQNLAVLVLDTMADQTPQTVSSLVNILNALPSFLPNLFCSGVSQDLASLDALAQSGALDAFLPLAKAFKDRGETELLVRLLVRLQNDYDGVLRPLEGDLQLFLDSGSLESFLEVLDLSRTIYDPVSGQSAADITAESLQRLVDDDVLVVDPRGAQVPSLAYLIWNPLVELDVRVQQAGRGQDFADVADALFEVFLDRVQTPSGEVLRNGSLIPLAARVLDILSDALPTNATARSQDVTQAQQDLRDFGGSQDLVTILSLLRTIDLSPSKQLIDASIVNLLTPQRTVADDIFGALVGVLVLTLQNPPSANVLQDLAPFLARVVDPNNPLVPDAIRAFERLLTADQGNTTLNLMRAALNPAPGEQLPPATIIINVIQDVSAAGSLNGVAFTRTELAQDLQSVARFIRDRQSGLAWIYELIRNRQI